MIDLGSMQDGEPYLRATARTPVLRVGRAVRDSVGPVAAISGDRGSMTLPVEVADDMVDGVVWVPANSVGPGVLAGLASPGSTVTLKGADL
jgi:NADH-quinone oxidoreductase subunit G